MSTPAGQVAVSDFYNGIGTINWWGCSPAIDLLSKLRRNAPKKADGKTDADESWGPLGSWGAEPVAAAAAANAGPAEINVLLVGQGDIRHLLRTVAVATRHNPETKLHFFVVEDCVELVAKQILFLKLVLEPTEWVGLREKTELFLELLGNAHIRAKTSEYLATQAKLLTDLITDPERMKEEMPNVDISGLKFRERDEIEDVFRFWRREGKEGKEGQPSFDMEELWDYRLRMYLKQRYDARNNLADWDHSMKLRLHASVIHVKQFIHWRNTGLAYDLRDAEYTVSNRSLASTRVFREKGGSVEKRGFWGDVVTGPYIGLAAESEEQALMEVRNKSHIKHAGDVGTYNVSAHLHEVMTGTRYVKRITTPEEPETDDAADEGKVEDLEDEQYVPMANVKVSFLPVKPPAELATKGKYKGKMNVVYFSNGCAQMMTPDVAGLLAPGARIIAESSQYILDLKPEQQVAFEGEVTKKAKAMGATPDGVLEGDKQAMLHYTMP